MWTEGLNRLEKGCLEVFCAHTAAVDEDGGALTTDVNVMDADIVGARGSRWSVRPAMV